MIGKYVEDSWGGMADNVGIGIDHVIRLDLRK
jgi:hypothetical protein